MAFAPFIERHSFISRSRESCLFSVYMSFTWLRKFLKQKPPLPQHLLIGRRGEQYAKKHLSTLGMKYLTSNFSAAGGEIDLVFREGDVLVFVEVKTRTCPEEEELAVRPAGAINHKKRASLYTAAQYYLRKIRPQKPVWRLDVVEVILDSKANLFEIRHIRGVSIRKRTFEANR